MSGQYHTKNGRTSRRGAFVNGVWHCDCEPRMPAEKFQTKNGGKNHGRWFFTCQKPQPKRCPFFLWADDAKVREEAAVLNNSRSEPNMANPPETPRRSGPTMQPVTPTSRPQTSIHDVGSRRRMESDSQATLDFDRNDSYDWPSSGDDDLAELARGRNNSVQESPSKVARTPFQTSPTKRPYNDMTNRQTTPYQAITSTEDLFHTPSTSSRPTTTGGLMSPITTKSRPTDPPPTFLSNTNNSTNSNNLIEEILKILNPLTLPPQIESQLLSTLTKHDLRYQGIIKGRDITRLAVQSKDKKIAELQNKISTLEAERETSRTVIAHLKQDIATSPKRSRRPGNLQQQQQLSRSEV